VRPVRIGESRGPGVIGGCSRVPPDFFRVAKSHQLMGDLCTLSIHHWAAGLCSREPPLASHDRCRQWVDFNQEKRSSCRLSGCFPNHKQNTSEWPTGIRLGGMIATNQTAGAGSTRSSKWWCVAMHDCNRRPTAIIPLFAVTVPCVDFLHQDVTT